MRFVIGSLFKVEIPYTYPRKNKSGKVTIYYQRAVPDDLRTKYPSKRLKHSLGTDDSAKAAKLADKWNRHYEAEWALLRADPSVSAKAARTQAERLLVEHGIDPKAPDENELALEAFLSKLDEKRERYAGGDEETYHEASPEDFLPPVEVAAVGLLQKKQQDTLSDALSFYLETHHKGASESLRKTSSLAINGLISAVGDKTIEALSRADGRAYITAQRARGAATTTVRRYLRSIVAILNHYFREHEIDRTNPFAGLPIAGEGEDAEEREPFTSDELASMQTMCRAADDEPRWLLAMLSDVGDRLAGIGGLALDDIKLEADIPHVVFTPHPWRPLDKSAATKRSVPLTGAALWAAKRIVETAQKGQQFAFPRYVTGGQFNTNSASATLRKWLRSNGLDHTAHDLRHTMRDRLREVQCPEEIIDAIGGWARKTVGQGYGKGYSLKVLHEWLGKVTDVAPQEAALTNA